MSGKIVHVDVYVVAPNGNLVPMKLEIRHGGVSLFCPHPVCNHDAGKTLEKLSRCMDAQGITHEAMKSQGDIDRISFGAKPV